MKSICAVREDVRRQHSLLNEQGRLYVIASIYGMNFFNHTSPWNMPEVNWDFGYPFALIMMFGISAMFALYFWRRGWLNVFTR